MRYTGHTLFDSQKPSTCKGQVWHQISLKWDIEAAKNCQVFLTVFWMECTPKLDVFFHLHHSSPLTKTGVSKNRGTPKWMVYNGKPYQNGWFGDTIIFGNTQTWFGLTEWHSTPFSNHRPESVLRSHPRAARTSKLNIKRFFQNARMPSVV